MKPKPKTTVPVVKGTADAPSVMDVRSFPCPQCGSACQPDQIVTPEVRRELTPGGTIVNLASHYVYLRCPNCRLQLWIGVDENFKLLEEIDLGDDDAN